MNSPPNLRARIQAPDASPETRDLSRDECHRWLAATSFGRVAVTSPDGNPIIRPVNYVFDVPSQSVVIRTAHGSKLHALLAANTAVFEIDGLEPETRTGWSVIVSGVTEQVTDPSELARFEITGPVPWAPGEKSFLIRIRAFTVSGRRVALAS
jgi:uncharacterized protein